MYKAQLIDRDYESKDNALVALTETKEDVLETTTSKKILTDTIAFLEDKKTRLVAEIDKEILINQEMLALVTVEAEKARIVEAPIEEPEGEIKKG